jgi:uncharacterized protein YndB with AHSA1/START domain
MESSWIDRGDGSTLRTERVLAAPVTEVFDAFRRPERLATWWGPDGFTNTFKHFDFSPGGRWVYTMHGPKGANYENESVFREIEPDARIVIEHVVKPWYRLTISLSAEGEGTRVRWVQEFESPERAEQLRRFVEPANEQNLDRLAAVLRSSSVRN